MLSSDSLKKISNIFCGDTAGFYSYKQGNKLVEFFNVNFGTKDVYHSGFPSRWVYVHDKLVELINSHKIDRFFNIVLGKTYLMQEQSLSEVEAAEKIEAIYAEFNRIIHRDLCKITRNNGRYHLVKENDDLEPIGWWVCQCIPTEIYRISSEEIERRLFDRYRYQKSFQERI